MSVICVQMKFEAQRKAEEENRRREKVSLDRIYMGLKLETHP